VTAHLRPASGIRRGIGYDECKVIGGKRRVVAAGTVLEGTGDCVMLLAKLVLLGMLGQVTGGQADPTALTAQLGSRRYAEREAASEALERLGRPALTALRAARNARDPEVRNRAFGLIQKIEDALLTQSSSVRLDFDDTPLVDVMASLSQQTGFKVALHPESLPKWKYQRVTLRQPDPLPFWNAIDQLCDAAQLQYNLSMHGTIGAREPMFSLNDGAMRTITPNSDHGPFRVSLLSVDYERHISYSSVGVGSGFRPQMGKAAARRPATVVPSRANPVTVEQCTAQLVVAAEPRLSLSQAGALQVLEAVDDRNNSLLASGHSGSVFNPFPNYLGVMNGSVVQLQAQLHRPALAGETIKKLRGSIPLSVSSRRPDPLVVPLDGANGKRFENPDVELTIHEIRTMPTTHQTVLELSVKPKDHGTAAERPDSDAFVDAYRPDTQRLQLEIVDSRGQTVPSFPSRVDSETSRLTLSVNNLPTSTTLKELRYYTLTRATVSVPFEFKDIPMP
jgi:hypothetical protein